MCDVDQLQDWKEECDEPSDFSDIEEDEVDTIHQSCSEDHSEELPIIQSSSCPEHTIKDDQSFWKSLEMFEEPDMHLFTTKKSLTKIKQQPYILEAPYLRYKIIKEETLLREVLCMLRGHEGDVFSLEDDKFKVL